MEFMEFVDLSTRPADPATIAHIANGKVTTAPLICGDGVDLVMTPVGAPSRTIQLTCAEARELSAALRVAANESEHL